MRATDVYTREVGIREFRARLRYWFDQVRKGREIVVTERGRPVARLVRTSDHTGLERLIEAGLVRPATAPRKPDSAYRRVRARGSISDIVIEHRTR